MCGRGSSLPRLVAETEHRPTPVDDEHPALTRLRQHRLEQRVVLKALDRDDRPGEARPATELAELGVARLQGIWAFVALCSCSSAGSKTSPPAAAVPRRTIRAQRHTEHPATPPRLSR